MLLIEITDQSNRVVVLQHFLAGKYPLTLCQKPFDFNLFVLVISVGLSHFSGFEVNLSPCLDYRLFIEIDRLSTSSMVFSLLLGELYR